MKKIIKLLFLLFVALHGNSQGLNTELGFNDEYTQYVQGVMCSGPYSYLVLNEGKTGTIVFEGVGKTTRLIKIDTLGNKLWDVVLAPKSAEFVAVHQLGESSDGGIYLFGYAELIFAHPTVPDGYFCFLQKQDTSGNMVWMTDWIVDDYFTTPFTGFSVGTSGELFLNRTSSAGSMVFTISPSGVITDSLLITEPKMEGFTELSGFTFTGFRNDSLMGFDATGLLVHNVSFTTPVQGMKGLNDTLYVLTQDSIFSFTGNLLPIHASAVQGFASFRKLKVDGDDIRFLSHGPGSITVFHLNRQLQTTGTLTIPEAISQDAYIDVNDMHLSAGITFNLTEFSAVRFLNFSMNSIQNATINRTDIGVINVAQTLVDAWPFLPSPNAYHARLEADVLIRNFGTNTLQSCRITRFNAQGVMGNPSVYAQEFHNLNLAPGDSMWLSLGVIFLNLVGTSGNEIKRNVCIHTNHPNGLVDLNVSNDIFCKDILFGYVSIEETAPKEGLLSLYPNPFNDALNIELPENMTDAQIGVYDLVGKQVLNMNVTSNNQPQTITLDTGTLEPGIYIIHMVSKHGGRFVGKAVKR